MSASAATLAAVATKGFSSSRAQRVFVASGTPEGIRSFDWNPATGELTAAGVAANVEYRRLDLLLTRSQIPLRSM